MRIERVNNLSEQDFLAEYLLPGRPVIVEDAMAGWDVASFQQEALLRKFGNCQVQVYNDLFDLQTIDRLEGYLKKNFNRTDGQSAHHYVRWYSRFKDVDFIWSDEVFKALEDRWAHPYFLPDTSFVVPYSKGDDKVRINEKRYPYKGLFISGKGARTRLHRDPLHSDAILCQFYGEKKVTLIPPSQEGLVMENGEVVDIQNPDLARFPRFPGAEIPYVDVLAPGEVILFPAGWFHDVTCLSDSISVTWNFIHVSGAERFIQHLQDYPQDQQLEVVRFFLRDELDAWATAEEIIEFVREKIII